MESMTDTQEIATTEAPRVDAKGRPFPDDMTERAMLTELLLHMRQLADVVEDLSESPMVKSMMGGGNPLLAMFRS